MVRAVRGPTDEVTVVGERGRDERDVVQMRAAREGIVDDDLLAGPDLGAARVDRGPHRRGHGTEMHGDVLGLREQRAVGREQRARTVGPLLDVRAVRGAAEHRAHLVGDTGEPRDPHLQRRRIHLKSPARKIQAPSSRGSAMPAVGYPHRAIGFRDHCRTDDRARSTSGRSVMRNGAAIDARARTAITSIGAPGRDVSVPAFVLGRKVFGRTHGELVTLTDVATVDRGLDDRTATDARPGLASRPRRARRRATRP